MGNCISNSGKFEPPGSSLVNDFVIQYDRHTDPRWLAVKAAEDRADAAERARAAAVQAQAPPVPAKPKGPKCSICKNYINLTVNPWQSTRIDLMTANMPDDEDDEPAAEPRAKPPKRGVEVQPCKHTFCGACLAQAIYRNLNVPFDPSTYGTKLHTTPPAPLGGKINFPMGCPSCQVKPGEQMVELGDMLAKLVLGEGNMDEWQHARYVSTLDIIYCPHKGCNQPFDANDVAPALVQASYAEELAQCPVCKNSLCRKCKVVWHDKLTCEEYQALPVHERAPEDLQLLELARQEKWRRCPKCNAMVELKYGCNHITCTCKHHFCYTCGADFEYKNDRYRCTSGKGCKVWDEAALLERR